jgi:photosystem II stability/assembly factor-like uncharacterized protein
MKSSILATGLAVVLASAAPAAAQAPRPPAALEALTDVLDLARAARGWVVRHREGTLVLRGDDDRISRINTAGLDAGSLALLKEGRYVTVAVKPSATPGAMPIAASVQPGEIDPSAAPR